MVGVAVIGLACAGIFEILRIGTVLFGKNTAMNVSHSGSRYGLLKLQQDLTSAVSTPLLTSAATPVLSSGSASTIITGTGPAAGVYFQDYAGGPFCLLTASGASSTTMISSSATSLTVVTGSNFRPLAGETIHIAATPLTTTSSNSMIELPISSVTTSGSTSTVTFPQAIGSNITRSDYFTWAPLYVACFFTTPVVYVVQNGQLIKYGLTASGTAAATTTATVLVNNCNSTFVTTVSGTLTTGTTGTPFCVQQIDSSPANTYIKVSGFTAIDESSNNRLYKAVTTPFTVTIPHFTQMTIQY
jgi:hypothetical protein